MRELLVSDPVKVLREAVRRGRRDAELLDGREFDKRFWDAAWAAVIALAPPEPMEDA